MAEGWRRVSGHTVVVTTAVLAVALLLGWAAATGPVEVLGHDRHRVAQVDRQQPPSDSQQDDARAADDQGPHRGGVASPVEWTHEIAAVVVVAALLWFLAVLLQAGTRWVVRRLPEPRLVLDLDPLPDVERARRSLATQRARQEAALARGDARNGIVACWVSLEDAAAAADVERRPAETSTEFVVRFLHALDVDPRPVAELSRLYQEARFSTHTVSDGARDRARSALAAIHADLPTAQVPA